MIMVPTTNTRTPSLVVLIALGRRTHATDDSGLCYSRPTDDDVVPAAIPDGVDLHSFTGRDRQEANR